MRSLVYWCWNGLRHFDDGKVMHPLRPPCAVAPCEHRESTTKDSRPEKCLSVTIWLARSIVWLTLAKSLPDCRTDWSPAAEKWWQICSIIKQSENGWTDTVRSGDATIKDHQTYIPVVSKACHTCFCLQQTSNDAMLQELPGPHFKFSAVDSKRDDQTRCFSTAYFTDMTAGLPSSITLTVNAKVILTKHLDVRDGLVNTAFGTVTGFLPPPKPGQDFWTHSYQNMF